MTPSRPYKGKSLLAYPDDYTVVDVETNGYGERFDIIELSAIKVRQGKVVDTFSSFIRPRYPIDWFITNLTGITDRMVCNAPLPTPVLAAFASFAEDDVLIGHNVNYDVNSIYDEMETYLGRPLTNDFVDVLRLSRKWLPDLDGHKQVDVAAHFGIDTTGAHRALVDCEICNGNYRAIREIALSSAPARYEVYGEDADIPWVYLIAEQADGKAVWDILAAADVKCRLVVIPCEDWSRDLSPWQAKAVFGKENFGGGAVAYLEEVKAIVQEVEGNRPPASRVLAGYSLAGLFALYAAYQCPLFDGLVAASPSVWFDGWLDYVKSHSFACTPACVYLSIGDREKFSRNPRLQGVEDALTALADHYRSLEIPTRLVLNPGNHFADIPARIADGIAQCVAYALDNQS